MTKKRGRPPSGPYAVKQAVVSTRMRSDTKAKLDSEAKKHGWGLSQEIEHRLRRSFDEDDKIADAFGDRRTFRLMRMMTDAIRLSEKKAGDWLNDPDSFQIALSAALSVLEAVEPVARVRTQPPPPAMPGVRTQPPPPATPGGFDYSSQGLEIAAKVWRDVKNAKASIPLKGPHRDHINSVAQKDLGPEMMERVDPIRSFLPRLSVDEQRREDYEADMADDPDLRDEEDQRGEK